MNLTPQLIEKYRLGQCSPEEKEFVEHALGIEGNVIPRYPFPEEMDEKQLKSELWSSLNQQIQEESASNESQNLETAKTPFLLSYGRYLTGLAACLVLAVGFSLLYQNQSPIPSVAKTSLKKVVIPEGQKAEVKLVDGTKIQLNGGSTLAYPEKFDDSIRLVYLSGEAFFDVAHNKAKPFVIKSSTTSVRVLGTSFNLKAYNGEVSRVSVVTGKVQFWLNDNPEQRLILTAGDIAAARDKVAKEVGEAASHNAWRENRLVFDNTPMREVVRTLERHYGADLELRIGDEAKKRLTGSFGTIALETMLERLEYSLDIHYKKEGRKIIIY